MKKTIFVLIALLALTSLFAVSAAAYPTVEGTPLLLDDAGLLSETEFAQVESDLKTYSDMHGIDIAVVTVNSLEEFGYTGYDAPMNFADDYFDYNGFGRGADRSGLVLVLAMQTRDWWISTRGSAIRTFTDYGINTYIGEKGIVPMFHSGQYAAAFREYAARADALIRYEKENGEPYDYDSDKEPVKTFSLKRLLGSLAAGLLAGLVPVSSMKSQLKSVRAQHGAQSYAKADSLNVTNANDYFIGRHVSRSLRQTERSGGGGSSTHVSSSGATHGGGGGKF